ncbi:MAG: hypothetical protein RLZZ459_2289, partial [Cyanobacteriota bacterium]
MTISKRGVLAPAGLAGSDLLLAAPAQAHHLMEIMNLQATP